MIFVVHSGQTGVERGAHQGALVSGLKVAGFMSLECRDELGPIPDDVAARLTPCFERGPRRAVQANIAIASGVVLLVPTAARPERFTAMSAVLQGIRATELPFMVCDAQTNVQDVRTWATRLQASSGSTRIMVTGPRATRWQDGENLARRLVGAIASSG